MITIAKKHKNSRALKYCKVCNYTWEIGVEGNRYLHRYDHMPTYKLPRVICRLCKK